MNTDQVKNAVVSRGPLSGRSRLAASLASLLILGALTPWLSDIDALGDRLVLLATLSLASFGMFAAWLGGLRPAGLTVYTFYLVWLGIAPTYQLSHGELAWDAHVLLDDRASVSAALLLSFAFLAGFFVVERGLVARPREAPQVESSGSQVMPNARSLWVMTVAALFLVPVAVRAAGGLDRLFETREYRAEGALAAGYSIELGSGVGVGLATILPVAVTLAACHLAVVRMRLSLLRGGASSLLVTDLLAGALALAALFVVANPMSNSRFIVALAWGSLLLQATWPRRRVGGALFLLGTLAVTLFAYPLADAFRRGDSAGVRGILSSLSGPDFDGFQQWVGSVLYVNAEGFAGLHYLVSSVFYPIPRSVWEGKATPASIDVANYVGYDFTNLSLPLGAEFYLSFGGVGVLLGAALLAAYVGYFDLRWKLPWVQPGSFVAPVAIVSILGIMRGPLGSLVPVWASCVVVVWFAAWFGFRKGDGNGASARFADSESRRGSFAVEAGE